MKAFQKVKKSDTHWVTRAGEELNIDFMTDQHIFSCVMLLKKCKAKVPKKMKDRMPYIKQIHPEYFL